MAKTATKEKPGLTARSFTGLNKDRMAKKASSENFGKRVMLDKDEPHPVQFLADPSGMFEFDMHSWKDGNKWYFVPCAGDGCPLCDDEDKDKAKVSYRFLAKVWSFKEKKVKLLEGPKDLANRVSYRFERKPDKFLKRTFDISKFSTTPVTYDVAQGDDDPLTVAAYKKAVTAADAELDYQTYVDEEIARFYGAGGTPSSKDLDAKDDDSDDGAEPDADELREMLEALKPKDLKARASKYASKGEVADLDSDGQIDLIIKNEAPAKKSKKDKAAKSDKAAKGGKAEKPGKSDAKDKKGDKKKSKK